MKNHNWKTSYLSTLQSEIDKIKEEITDLFPNSEVANDFHTIKL